MSTLTNDLNFTLSNPAPRGGLLGTVYIFRAKDYRSWRKIMVGLRRSLISAKCLTQKTEFHTNVCGWLAALADRELLKEHPTAFGVAMVRVINEPDPVLQFPIWAGLRMDTASRFPADPPMEFHWVGQDAGANYSDIGNALVDYIKEGWELYQEGMDEDQLPVDSTEVRRAERRPAPINWVPAAVVGFGLASFFGLVLYGAAKIVPVYSQYKKAARMKA